MKLNVQLFAKLSTPSQVPAILQVEVPDIADVQVVERSRLTIDPETPSETYSDFYQNMARRAVFPAGGVSVTYEATVVIPEARPPKIRSVDLGIMDLPPEVLHYLLPSRYCESERLEQFASAEFASARPGFDRIHSICSWINEHVKYEYGHSTVSTTAFDTATERVGVCRDFAHLGIALCRALNVPARYVSGYCLDLEPPDLHAYFQAYLDGVWVSFDATEMQPRQAMVTAGIGRDAADCAWCSFFGAGSTEKLDVAVTRADS